MLAISKNEYNEDFEQCVFVTFPGLEKCVKIKTFATVLSRYTLLYFETSMYPS